MRSPIRTATVGLLFVPRISAALLAQVPANLQATATGPTTVELTWTAVPTATNYAVQRATGTATFVRVDATTNARYTDVTAPAGGSLRYRIKANYPSPTPTTYSSVVTVTTPAPPPLADRGMRLGTPIGAARQTPPTVVTANAPPPATAPAGDPTGFTATVQGDQVVLSWQAVSGVSWYVLGGPGTGPNGQQVQGTTWSLPSPGIGSYEWTVASLAGQEQGPINNWMNWSKARLSITPANLTSGRYRISIAGFKVNHETFDDPLERDGKHDEVYAAAFVEHFDRPTGRFLGGDLFRTKTYGDANNHPERVPQGHASDVGGLMTGDVVPFGWDEHTPQPLTDPRQFPLVLWDDVLTDGKDAVVVRPTLWEEDGDHTGFDYWHEFLVRAAGANTWSWPPLQADLGQTAISSVPGGELLFMWSVMSGWPGYDGDKPNHVDAGRDRPVGFQHAYDATHNEFFDLFVVLTREKIEAELTRPGLQTRGLVAVRLKDAAQGSELALSGDYTLYLRVERLQ